MMQGTQMECKSQSFEIQFQHFLLEGVSCFDFTPDKTGLVLVKELSQDVLANAKGAVIVILEVTF